jgi:hypothetical protein
MNEILNSPTAASLWDCIILAIASASLSMTITQTEIFAPLRALALKSGHMIGHLFHCFYCMSHWVVIAGISVYRPIIISSGIPIIDWTVSAFFTIALSAFFSGLIFKVFLSAMAKAIRERELKETMNAGG